MSPNSHSLLQYQKLRGHMTAQSKGDILHMALELSFGHGDDSLRRRGLSSVPFPLTWLEFKFDSWNLGNPWSRRAKPGMEAARTRRHLGPSWLCCHWIGPDRLCLWESSTLPSFLSCAMLVLWLLLLFRALTNTPGHRWWRAHAGSHRRGRSAIFLMSACYLQSAAS